MFIEKNHPPIPPDWWDPRPATVRYHRPGWRVLLFVLIVVCGGVLMWTGHGRESAVLALAGIGLAGVSVAGWVAEAGRLPRRGGER